MDWQTIYDTQQKIAALDSYTRAGTHMFRRYSAIRRVWLRDRIDDATAMKLLRARNGIERRADPKGVLEMWREARSAPRFAAPLPTPEQRT